ncbi:putative reverse transcriptase domain-containing protein [Tanacetum coccineum]
MQRPLYYHTEPTSFTIANNSTEWRQAMKEEYDALMKNGMWSLVPRASNTNVVDAAVDAMLPQIATGSARYRTGAVASVAPVDAENWISHMEKIFDVMDCNDAFKTRLAVYKFEGDALAWWKAYKQAKEEMCVLTLTWAAFKELFFLSFLRQLVSWSGCCTAEEAAKNFRWGLHKSILDHVRTVQQEAEGGDRYQSDTQQNNYRSHDQKNDRQGSDRQGGGGNYRNNNNNKYSRDNNRSNLNRYRLYLLYDMNLTSRHGNRNSGAGRDQRNRGSQQSRVPSEGYTHPVCNTCGRRHPGECRRAAGTCFKCGQAGHLQRDCKKNIGASSSGHADKKPDASGLVLCTTQDQAANTSDWLAAHRAMIDCHSRRVIFGDIHAPEFIYHGSLPGKSMKIISQLKSTRLFPNFRTYFRKELQDTSLFEDVELTFIAYSRYAEQSPKPPYRKAPIEVKRVEDQLQSCWSEVYSRRVYRMWCPDSVCKMEGRLKKNTRSISALLQILRQEKLYAKFQSANFGEKVAFSGSHCFSRELLWIRKGEGYHQCKTDVDFQINSDMLLRRVCVVYSCRMVKHLSSLSKLETLPYGVRYHPGKANVVADALSRKSGMIAGIKVEEGIIRDLERLDIELCVPGTECQRMTENLGNYSEYCQARPSFRDDDDGILWQGSTKITTTQATLLVEWYEGDVATFVSKFNLSAGNWDDYICLVEFAYNNSWHASIKCAPFEMLYGRKCRAPICWDQVGERILEGPEMIGVTNEKVAVAREKLKEAQTRQKSYADRHRRALEFQPGEHVFLKVSPTRGAAFLVSKGKLSYKYHPLHVVSYPFDQIREDLSYTEEPESILDRQDRIAVKQSSFHLLSTFPLLLDRSTDNPVHHFDVLYYLGHMFRPLDFFYVIHVDLIIGSRCLIPAFHLVLLGRYSERLSKALFDLDFKSFKTDPSLFIYSRGDTLLYILVYVDDIIVTCNNKGTIDNIICQLGSAFALKDLGPLNYFLGIEIVPHVSDILLSQKKYILELLQSAGLSNCNPVSSPMVTSSSLSLDDSTAFSNPVKYRQVVVKRILRYLHGTVEHDMLIRCSSGSTLQAFTDVLWKGNPDTSLEAFSDADWAGDSDDRRSTGGFAIYLGSNLISWIARKQRTVSRSSTEEAEYKALADTVAELT